MRRPNFQELSGAAQYEGFCVDMLHELADILKFRFQIKLVEDGLYGAPEPNGSWTGMVGELINRVGLLGKAHPPPASFFFPLQKFPLSRQSLTVKLYVESKLLLGTRILLKAEG